MLTLTPDAAQAVNAITSQPGLPDDAGLRIAGEQVRDDAGAPRTDLRLSVVEAPQPDDEVLDEAPLFIDSETSPMLADKVLDADFSGEQVRFSIQDQATG